MQVLNTRTNPQADYCQVDIFADEDLFFNVRVSCGGKRFIAGGFMNPDEAQRRGVQIMLAMSGLPVSATVVPPRAAAQAGV